MNQEKLEKKFQSIKKSKRNKGCLFLELYRDPIWVAKGESEDYLIVFLLKNNRDIESPKMYGNLEFEVLNNCEIMFKKRKKRQNIAVITLSDVSLKNSFFLFLESFSYVKKPQRFSDPREIIRYIEEWKELFIGNSSLSHEEQLGLWGELYLINQYPKPDKVIEKWHGPEQKLFDFFSGKLFLDVKTSNKGTAHYFSLNQIKNEHPVFIYSLEVTEDPAGNSITELIENIKEKIKNKALFFEKLVKTKILNTQPIPTRFVPFQKRIIAGENIPQPRKVDIGVEAVRFKSETSSCIIEGNKSTKVVLDSLTR